MKTETKKIPFNDGELLGVRLANGQVYLAVRKACRDIGLSDAQARAEVTKIQTSLLFQSNCLKFETVQEEGKREVSRKILILHEKFVPMWLAQINLTPAMQKNNPDTVSKLLKYQLEAANTLHEAFYSTEEQKETLHNELGLKGRIEVMTVQLNNIEQIIEEQAESINSVFDNMTLSTRQQQKLHHAAKDRINLLLDGAHGLRYEKFAKSYFINLWNGLKSLYGCASYKDLNPRYFNSAFDYISEWELN